MFLRIATISMGFFVTILTSWAHAQAFRIKVTDAQLRPVSQAKILVGFEPGKPFEGNVAITNSNGEATLSSAWKAILPLTVEATGYITLTRPLATPGNHVIPLTRKEGGGDFEIKGTTSEYGRLITDGKVDFGLVIPAVRRDQLLAFDVSSVVSPQNDIISVIGNEVKIPSNIALPRQTETYVFPIEFNKPDYRVYVRQSGTYTMGAIHGQFPLQRVVNDIRAGKSIFELINYFDFKQSGQKDVEVNGNIANVNLAVNQSPFPNAISVKAPAYNAQNVMVSMALRETNDSYLPTDLKRVEPNQTLRLKSTASDSKSILSLLIKRGDKSIVPEWMSAFFQPWILHLPRIQEQTNESAKQDYSQFSFAFLSADGGANVEFLPLIAKPSISNQIFRTEVPTLTGDLAAAAMYISYSEIESVENSERRTRLWEVWSNAWTSQLELPKLDFETKPNRKYRWEVVFMAQPRATLAENFDLKTITHATRNSIDQ